MFEVDEAARVISSSADPDANIIFGAVIDPNLLDEFRVTVIATGFGDGKGYGSLSQKKEQSRTISIVSAETVFKKPEEKDVSVRHVPVTISTPSSDKKTEQKTKGTFAPEVTKIADDGWDIPAFIRRKKM